VQHQKRRRRVLRMASVFLLCGVSGCGDVGRAIGDSPAAARANADMLFFALGARFGPRQTAPGFEEARSKFARSALIPSRIYDDPELWTGSRDEIRFFEIAGRPARAGYVLGLPDGVRPLRAAGEYRRSMRLDRLSRAEYEWAVRDELAVGRVMPDDLARSLTALLRAAETSDSAAVRAACRRALPATTSALGRLFALDSVALTPAGGGGTEISLVATLHTQRVAGEFPLLARYLERYASPFRFELVVEDLQGVRWWTASKHRDRMTVRLKVRDGYLVPLVGPPRRMPDQLRLRADLATRIRIFGIGVSDLIGDLRLTRTAEEKAFTARFATEPGWHLPLFTERLIRTPLRRPFAGDGVSLRMAVHTSDHTSLLLRDYGIIVQESAILRWFGGLGSTVVGDFRRGADEEFRRFVGEVFHALRADAAELLR
jgi:hypothetical protein